MMLIVIIEWWSVVVQFRNRVTLPLGETWHLGELKRTLFFNYTETTIHFSESFSQEDDIVIKHPPFKIAKIYSISLSPYLEFCCEKWTNYAKMNPKKDKTHTKQ